MCEYSYISHTHSLFIQSFHRTHGEHTSFCMPPKISKTKGDAKGKGNVGKSSTTIENPLSLVSSEYVDAFE